MGKKTKPKTKATEKTSWKPVSQQDVRPACSTEQQDLTVHPLPALSVVKTLK